MDIIIEVDGLTVQASLKPTDCGQAIYDMLPCKGSAMTWGEEIYFEVPVRMDLDETAKETVSLGDIGYWPKARAFCIFFGRTPVSAIGEIRPASAVNVIGWVSGDPTILKKVREGSTIQVRRL